MGALFALAWPAGQYPCTPHVIGVKVAGILHQGLMTIMRIFSLTMSAAFILTGCASTGPQVEKGPGGTIAYSVAVDSNPQGARVEANNEFVGKTPFTLKIFGDKDGTFHNFGRYTYTVTGYSPVSGQAPQSKQYKCGGWFTAEDMIPKQIFFEFGAVPPAKTDAK